MELDQLTWKLAEWAFMLHEYDFDIVHKVSIVSYYVDGLSQNLSSNEKISLGFIIIVIYMDLE
jgi:hypothetical protein